MSETKIEIGAEEAAALWEWFGKDVEDGLPVKAYDEWFNMDTDLDDALRKALTLAVARERERCLSIIREVNALNADDPRLIVSKRTLEEIEKRIRGEE